MRLGILCFGVLAITAAHAQRNKDETGATKRACSVEECFFERDVRDFEVIDQTHVIVYTGSQRCAFQLELRGTFCDLTYAPELYFSRRNEVSDRPPAYPQTRGERRDPNYVDPLNPLAIEERGNRNLRVCSNDLMIQVDGGRFTESTPSQPLDRDALGNPRTQCQVSSVKSITDDQLLEFYVARGVVPPLPPMGTGEIEVGEPDEPGQDAAREDAPPPDEPKTSGRAKK
jgi:hypothetical protein